VYTLHSIVRVDCTILYLLSYKNYKNLLKLTFFFFTLPLDPDPQIL
jgi:hypothetical protein